MCGIPCAVRRIVTFRAYAAGTSASSATTMSPATRETSLGTARDHIQRDRARAALPPAGAGKYADARASPRRPARAALAQGRQWVRDALGRQQGPQAGVD